MGKRRFLVWFMAAIMAVSALALAGCGKSSEEVIREGLEQDIEKEMAEVEQRVDEYVAYIEKEAPDVKAAYDVMGISMDDIFDPIVDSLEMKVGDINIDEKAGTGTAEIELTCISYSELEDEMEELLMKVMQDATYVTDKKAYMKDFAQEILGLLKNAKTKTTTIDVAVERDGNVWSLAEGDYSDEITEAMMG